MIRGRKVVLRAVLRDDVPLLFAWNSDYDLWPSMNDKPYVPTRVEDALKRFDDGESYHVTDVNVPFAVEAEGRLVGGVSLWGIDAFNRYGHLGITLGPDERGKGYGSDACRTLVHYAFSDRGLHRVQLEVPSTNTAARRAYEAAGFVVDGVLREAGWVRGGFVDEVVMSVLATDPAADPGRQPDRE